MIDPAPPEAVARLARSVGPPADDVIREMDERAAREDFPTVGPEVGGSRTGAAELRRLSLRESSGGDGNGDGEGTTSDPDEETGGGDGSDGGADGSGGGGSGDDADGDGEANDGALGLPGFGTGAAIVGTLGATEYLRRRD